MKCSKHSCGGTLYVSHTYTVRQEKFQRALCPECRTIYCLSTIATPVRARGDGAKASATRARQAKQCNDSTP